jgi:hypothetical protein
MHKRTGEPFLFFVSKLSRNESLIFINKILILINLLIY